MLISHHGLSSSIAQLTTILTLVRLTCGRAEQHNSIIPSSSLSHIFAPAHLIMDVSCACGSVRFTTPTSAPLALFHCHCIDCRKQSASAFGTTAAFPFFQLPRNNSITHFDQLCDSGRTKRCFFCKGCGSRIMHMRILEEGTPKTVSIKGGLIEGLDWTGGTHIFCRSAVVPIPEGARRYEAEPTD